MKKLLWTLKIFICAFVFANSPTDLSAQPFTIRQDLKPLELTLGQFEGEDKKEKGRISCVNIEQTEDTLYLFAKGISIYSPVFVSLTTEQGSPGVKINMYKENWNEAVRTGETDNDGHWDTKFKTEGDFGITVIAKDLPASYNLLVWVGDEVQMALPMVYTKPGAEASFFNKYLLYIVIGIAVLGVLLFLLRRKKRNTITALLLLLFCIPVVGKAQSRIQNVVDKADKSLTAISNNLLVSKNPELSGMRTAVSTNTKRLYDLLKADAAQKQMLKDYKKLSSSEADVDFGQSSSVMMPSECLGEYVAENDPGGVETLVNDEDVAKQNQACACFSDAAKDLDGLRRGLARLRVICTNTKNFTTSAIAFGDAASGAVGVGGLAWYPEREGILNSYTNFQEVASSKHTELMADVDAALKKMGQCQASFGEKSWYQKFGFMYYQFLYDHYKP